MFQNEKLNLLLVSPDAKKVVAQLSLPTERVLPVEVDFGAPEMAPDYLPRITRYFQGILPTQSTTA